MKFSDIKVGDNSIVFYALVTDCKIKQTVNQTPYYGLIISDGETLMSARIWTISLVKDLSSGDIKVGDVYKMTAKVNEYAGKPQIIITKIEDAPKDEVDWSSFYRTAPIQAMEIRNYIREYTNKISNPILKMFVTELIGQNADKFFEFPAAITMHHNYLSGLAYHTYSMLRLADAFLINYPSLNKDLMYSGILLHDIGKISEFTEAKTPAYSQEGNLLGHIVIALQMLANVAYNKKVEDTEEYITLCHIIASHHGELEFGSPKEPLIAEAQAIFIIDFADSRMSSITDEVVKVEAGEYTNQIATVNRKSFYVPKI